MNKNIVIHRFNDRSELFEDISNNCEERLKQQLTDFNNASFIVPGGTTPSPAFELLSKNKLPWDKITIAQSDERWVDANHLQSNERLTRNNLLINEAKNANYISMKNLQNTPFDGETEVNISYKNLKMPFTITMLGMGLDGHIASLFPGARNIEDALSSSNHNICIAIDALGCPVAGNHPERISLTLTAILQSKSIFLLITGKEKIAVIKKALEKKPSNEIPVSFLLHQTKTPVEIFWSE